MLDIENTAKTGPGSERLDMIVNLQTGTTTGHINCSAPTCCDDLAALARRTLFLQMIMDIVEFYKNRERYGIQTTKSSNLPLHLSTESKKNSTDTCVTLDAIKFQMSLRQFIWHRQKHKIHC